MAHYCLANHSLRFVVCVDPMCGSNSVRDWFINSLPDEAAGNRRIEPHMVSAHTVANLDGYRRIFVVRNPLDRLVSFYLHWVVHDDTHWCFADHERRVGLRGATFRELLEALQRLAERGRRFQHHLEPQTRTLGDMVVDDVVKLDQFDQRMGVLNEGLGLDYLPPRRNALGPGTRRDPDPSDLTPGEVRELGPFATDAFYADDDLRILARSIYAADARFYESH